MIWVLLFDISHLVPVISNPTKNEKPDNLLFHTTFFFFVEKSVNERHKIPCICYQLTNNIYINDFYFYNYLFLFIFV